MNYFLQPYSIWALSVFGDKNFAASSFMLIRLLPSFESALQLKVCLSLERDERSVGAFLVVLAVLPLAEFILLA